MSTEIERPKQKPLPCSANPLSHQVTQLRNGLAKATDNVSLAGPGTEEAVTQLKLALGAIDEALVLLAKRKGITEFQNEIRVKNRLTGNL